MVVHRVEADVLGAAQDRLNTAALIVAEHRVVERLTGALAVGDRRLVSLEAARRPVRGQLVPLQLRREVHPHRLPGSGSLSELIMLD